MENLNVKFSEVRVLVSFFAQTMKFRFLQAPEKGVKLDSKTAVEFAEREFDLTELPASIFADCIFSRHGLKQKMVDSLAMNKELKEATTMREVVESLTALWDQFKAGHFLAPSRATAAPSVKVSDMEATFLKSVAAGVTTFEQAAMLYKSLTGKDLPAPVTPEVEENTEEEVTSEP